MKWIDIGKKLPRKNTKSRKYSVPVLVADASLKTHEGLFVYDYENNFWLPNHLPAGKDPKNYERISVTHWGYLPAPPRKE